MSFLKAEWRKLAMANYEIDPELLVTYLPPGTVLDLWEGRCFISLIGFMFQKTRLLGIPIPFHINFEEVNLRFYVKRYENNQWKRGVVFIKELVPKFALAFIANLVYKEHYEALPMRHKWQINDHIQSIEYSWKKNSMWNSINFHASTKAEEITENSFTEFITEHYWGYSKSDDKTSNEYEVTHPRWLHYHVLDHEINVDFAAVYGEHFAFLNNREPDDLILAEGSSITVEKKRKISV